ncbi:MAG TPA: hypothetical protein VK809_11030 [Bacteroidia bacterium]|nr:hypothetical protein [Bacteroidia bacterium]
MNCIITGLPTQDYIENDTYIEYSIDYKRKPYKLKFPKKDELFDDYKKALKSLLFRGEWPFDPDTLITKHLMGKMIGWLQYPNINDFDKKVLAYLEWLYKNGGKEHNPLYFVPSEYWQARANNEEEFGRILEDLEYKAYITIPINNEFKLTKEGTQKVENIQTQQPESILKKYATVYKPRIAIINATHDEIAANRLNNYFHSKGFSTIKYGDLEDDAFVGSGRIHNLRSIIREENGNRSAEYWVFIKSANSDKNLAYGSLLTVAAELHHELGRKRYPNMISIAVTDDSKYYTWPVYDEYYNHFFEARLEGGKERLAEAILIDWVEMQNKKLKTKEIFWKWFLDLCNQLTTNSILLRPSDISELIESEEKLKRILDELINDNLIAVRQLPGIKNDQFEYEITIHTEEDRKGQGEESISNYLDINPIKSIERIFKNFHKVAMALRERREDNATLTINNEYDVQDLLHSLLQLYFEDVRKEEGNISDAGSNTRLDFLLKNENIAIEVKMTRENLKDKKICDELIVDIARYKEHKNCKTLVIFIYDKGYYLRNRGGVIRDLEKHKTTEMDIKVYIMPPL